MKYLWLSLFTIISILSVNAQFNATWLSDWQNSYSQQCIPSSFEVALVAGNGSAANINYYFNAATLSLTVCQKAGITANYTSTLSSSVLNQWVDAKGPLLNFDPTSNTVSYFPAAAGSLFLYTATGAILPQQDSLGSIGATWSTPTPVASANNAGCCVPDTIFVSLVNLQPQISATYNYITNTTCTNSTSTFSITPAPGALNWANAAQYAISFASGASLTQIVATTSATANTCQYTYQRTNPSAVLNNTWLQDWQNNLTPAQSIASYLVTPVTSGKSTYMTSTITDAKNNVFGSFVTQTPTGQFFDALFGPTGTTFTYTPASDTLLSTNNLLLSHTGVLYASSPFVNTWTNAVALTNGSIPSGCCLPTQVVISNNGTGQAPLQVLYTVPTDYANIPGCHDLVDLIDSSNQIASTLTITTPNINQLVWTDANANGAQVYLANAASNTNLAVTGFSVNCAFSLSVPPTPVPNPPLSATLLSSGIVSVIVGLFALFMM